MFEQASTLVSETLFQLYLLLPVGLIGLWRWGVWLIRKLIGLRYRYLEPGDFTASVSIIVPVYNENPDVFCRALASWAHEKPNEIVAVIDHSDKACLEKFREFSQTYPGARLIITHKPGKRPALADGIQAATSDIVALVDSDTIWEEGILAKVVAPFVDPEVGGVGTRQNVLEPKTLAQKIFDIHLDSRYMDEIRFLATAGDALTCLSGRTAVYRRTAVLPQLDSLLNETFWGRPVISGDDKRLTHLVQAEGWKVRYQEQARVYTPGAPKIGQFLKQRLRWTRNSWRADLRALYDGWIWSRPALAFHLLDRIVQPVTTLIAPIYFLIALYRQQWISVLILGSWWLISRAVKIYPHLRRRWTDIILLPAYILFTYVFAIFKIFAFFTMNHQGWITRWDSKRMKKIGSIRLVPAYSATFGMVFILGLGMFQIDTRHQARINERRFFTVESELPLYDLVQTEAQIRQNPPQEAELGATAVAQGLTSYQLDDGDTPETLAQKYGLDPQAILTSEASWAKGQTIHFQLPFKPHDTYRQSLEGKELSRVTYLAESNTILVSGFGSVINLSTLDQIIDKNDILDYEGKGVYLLKANLFVESHATLLLEGPDVSWLKLQSSEAGFVTLTTKAGNILINGIQVSSWDPLLNDYDLAYKDGRSYILARDARMDIINADIGYLGFERPASAEGQGGIYGLSWRINDYTRFGQELVTGMVENSKIHHNYFGVYTYGATGMVFRGNEIYSNVHYGLDPHDDSNNFIVEKNYFHDNGNHGLILSKRCFNNLVRWNHSENNALHGIMLDQNSNNNTIYGNILSGNIDGLAVWDSHRNEIFDNEVTDNQRGMRLNGNASLNMVRNNTIAQNALYGVYLYDGAMQNQIWQNRLERNDTGVYVRSSENFIIDNWISYATQGIYLTEAASSNQIVQNRIANNEAGIYLKTDPDDYLLHNIFLTNLNNVHISRSWRTPAAEEVAVVSH